MGNNFLGNFSMCLLFLLAIIYWVGKKVEHTLYFQAKGFSCKSSKNKSLLEIYVQICEYYRKEDWIHGFQHFLSRGTLPTHFPLAVPKRI